MFNLCLFVLLPLHHIWRIRSLNVWGFSVHVIPHSAAAVIFPHCHKSLISLPSTPLQIVKVTETQCSNSYCFSPLWKWWLRPHLVKNQQLGLSMMQWPSWCRTILTLPSGESHKGTHFNYTGCFLWLVAPLKVQTVNLGQVRYIWDDLRQHRFT